MDPLGRASGAKSVEHVGQAIFMQRAGEDQQEEERE
jgi:hypothetical protein